MFLKHNTQKYNNRIREFSYSIIFLYHEKQIINLFKEIINNSLKWDERLYDKALCDLKALVEDICKYNPIFIEYSATDLRKDDRWRKDVYERL